MISSGISICNKCILTSGFLGTEINDKGVCNYCENPYQENVNWSKTIISEEMRHKALKNWNLIIADMKEKHSRQKYDCVIGYSGGKDSTALLDYLINDLKLNPLAVTSDTGFMTPIAKENMLDTLNKINVDHIMLDNPAKTFTKLYKWHFLNHDSNDRCLARYICDYCSDLIHSIVVKEALKRRIPYVLFGYSPDQVARYYYEIPPDEIKKEWKPEIILHSPFNEEDKKCYLSEMEVISKYLPRVILPYHVIPYKEQEIIELVESKQLIKKGHSDPLLTNCNVVHAATFYDLNRFGGIHYALQYAELVRQDPSVRKKWLLTLKRSLPLILNNKFKEGEVTNFLNKIGVSKQELLNIIFEKLNRDPRKLQILENLEAIRNPKRRRMP